MVHGRKFMGHDSLRDALRQRHQLEGIVPQLLAVTLDHSKYEYQLLTIDHAAT